MSIGDWAVPVRHVFHAGSSVPQAGGPVLPSYDQCGLPRSWDLSASFGALAARPFATAALSCSNACLSTAPRADTGEPAAGSRVCVAGLPPSDTLAAGGSAEPAAKTASPEPLP